MKQKRSLANKLILFLVQVAAHLIAMTTVYQIMIKAEKKGDLPLKGIIVLRIVKLILISPILFILYYILTHKANIS